MSTSRTLLSVSAIPALSITMKSSQACTVCYFLSPKVKQPNVIVMIKIKLFSTSFRILLQSLTLSL